MGGSGGVPGPGCPSPRRRSIYQNKHPARVRYTSGGERAGSRGWPSRLRAVKFRAGRSGKAAWCPCNREMNCPTVAAGRYAGPWAQHHLLVKAGHCQAQGERASGPSCLAGGYGGQPGLTASPRRPRRTKVRHSRPPARPDPVAGRRAANETKDVLAEEQQWADHAGQPRPKFDVDHLSPSASRGSSLASSQGLRHQAAKLARIAKLPHTVQQQGLPIPKAGPAPGRRPPAESRANASKHRAAARSRESSSAGREPGRRRPQRLPTPSGWQASRAVDQPPMPGPAAATASPKAAGAPSWPETPAGQGRSRSLSARSTPLTVPPLGRRAAKAQLKPRGPWPARH